MTRRNKLLLCIVAVGLLAVPIYQLVLKNAFEPKTSVDPELRPIKQELLELEENPEFQKLSTEEQRQKTLSVLDRLPESYQQLKKQYEIAMSSLPEIIFHGRVVDQHGQPVRQASLVYTGESAYLASGGGMRILHTDDDGYFLIQTSGAALSLAGVQHPEIGRVGYDTPGRLATTSPPGEIIQTVRMLSNDSRGSILNYTNYSSKDKAYVIHAWRLAEKHAGAVGGNISTYYDADGSEYTLDLYPPHRNNYPNRGQTKGHIRVSCVRPHMEGIRDYGDWRISITPIDGGIQKTEDPYMNVAPESGYEPSLNIEMKAGSEDYRPHLRNQRYYFTSNNGREFGSLYMYIEPFSDARKEACSLGVSYRINPTGSRNLETLSRGWQKAK